MAAPNSCSPCGCIPAKMSIDYFRQALLVILCDIAAAIIPGAEGDVVVLPAVVKAANFFTNAYQALGLVDSEKKISHLVITNNTDGDLAISFNNSTENYRVFANTFKVIDFDKENVTLATDVYAKYITQPTIGSAVFEAYYFA